MSQFLMKPTLHQLDSVKEFVNAFAIGEGDLLFTNRHFYDDYFKDLNLQCDVIHPKDYGQGEPTDELIEAINKDITNHGELFSDLHRTWYCITADRVELDLGYGYVYFYLYWCIPVCSGFVFEYGCIHTHCCFNRSLYEQQTDLLWHILSGQF